VLCTKAIRLARLLLPATTLLAVLSMGAPATPTPATGPAAVEGTSGVTSAPAATDAVTGLPPEVRLRKLHLVRPDLIPYPIAYDVYC
jgi:hypothetical protein